MLAAEIIFLTVLSDDGCFWEAKNQCLYEDGSDHAGAKRKLRRKDSSEKIQWHFQFRLKYSFVIGMWQTEKKKKRKYKVYLNGRQEQNFDVRNDSKYCGK